ncbi:hypothetical protein [Geodermatophilus sp. SYSU D00079]
MRRRRPGAGGGPAHPTVVLVMAEHGGAVLWDRSPGGLGDLRPEDLGVPAELAARLADWNRRYEEHAARWDWGPPPPEHATADRAEWTAWTSEGLHLASALQHEFDARELRIDVRYGHDGDVRPVAERRGP